MKFVNLLKEIAKTIKEDTNDSVSLTELTDIALNAIAELEAEKTKLENMADNAHNALIAVEASGSIIDDDVFDMIKLGLDNKPQKPHTRLG